MAISLLRTLWGTFWVLFSSLLLVLAVVVVLLRATLPGIEYFKADIQQWIEQETGLPIQFGEMSVRLEGRYLQVVANRIVVNEPAQEGHAITLERGEVEVDLLQSIRSAQVVTTQFAIHQPRVVVTHERDGSVKFESLGGGGSQSPSVLEWLLRQPVIEIKDAELLVRNERLASLQWHLTGVNLHLLNSGYRHQASGSLVLNGEVAQPIVMELEWFGNLFNPYGWDGQMHLQGEQVELLALLGGDQNPLRPLIQGEATLELWGEWLSGKLEKGQGVIRREDDLQPTSGLSSGKFFWKRQGEEEWRLQLEQLVWGGEQGTDTHPSSALVVRKMGEQGQPLLMGAIDRLHLVSSPRQPGLYASVARGEWGVTLAGDLQQIKFRSVPNEETLFNQIEGKLMLSQLAVRGTGEFSDYGVDGVSGQLQLNQQRGVFVPAPGTLWLATGGIYSDPVMLGLQQGVLGWEIKSEGVLTTFDRMEGAFGGLEFTGGVQVLMPNGPVAPVVNMGVEFAAKDVTEVVKHLPASQLYPDLMAWLNQSLLAGTVPSGVLKLQGAMDQRFPYENGGGTFQVKIGVEDLDLQFDPEWPAIRNGSAQLIFANHVVRVLVQEGEIDGHPIDHVDAKGYTVGLQPIEIRGRMVSDSAALLHSLQKTPIRDIGKQVDQMLEIAGYALLGVDVTVPIDGQAETVDGRVELHDNRLRVKGVDLQLSDLAGNLEFTEEGIVIDGMRGQMLGGPVELRAFTARDELRQQMVVNLDGAFHADSMKQWIKLEPAQQHLFGGASLTPWRGRVTIGAEDLDLDISSSLRGIVLSTPAPLEKQAEEEWPTSITMKVHHGEVNDLRISIPKRLFARLKQIEQGDDRPAEWAGRIQLGNLGKALETGQESRGVTLTGIFEQVNLDQWYTLWKEQLDQKSSSLPRFSVDQVLIQADQAALFEQQLNNLILEIQKDQDSHWGVRVNSDLVAGDIRVPTSSTDTMVIALDYLHLGEESLEQLGDEKGTSGIEVDPTQFPPMEVRSQKTVIHGVDLGKLSLHTHPTGTGLFVDEAVLESPVMRASAQGSWTRQQKEKVRSHFNIDVAGDELGAILAQFGYGGEIVRGKSAIRVEADWPGAPVDFSLGTMEGELKVAVSEGQLRDVDQGVGRVFGLLGVHTLVRRLTLDFSDITDKGFAFDTIEGSFRLDDGDAHTRDLVIDGTAAMIKVAGRTGLVKQDYDQLVTVIPKISETLPATGALVGGPAGAALGSVIYLYQKLFEEEGLATIRYHLTGSWDDPQLEEMRPKPPVTEPDVFGEI